MVSLFDGYNPDKDGLWKPTNTTMIDNSLFGSGERLVVGREESVPEAIDRVTQEVLDRTNTSVTNFIKKSMVMSRVYIQRGIADDPSIDDNLACIQNQYLGFLLAALGLNTVVINNKTVRELVRVIATERFDTIEELACEAFGSFVMIDKDAEDLEYLRDNHARRRDDIKHGRDNQRDTIKHERDVQRDKDKHERDLERDDIKSVRDTERDDLKYERDTKRNAEIDNRANKTDSSVNKESRDLSFSSGRIIEFTFEGPHGKIKANIPVHMVPKVIPDEVAEQFVSLNFKLDNSKRWLQVLAGEKSFFKDYLLQLDLIKKKNDALKKDTDNTLYDMLAHSNDKAGANIRDKVKHFAAGAIKAQNLANTVLIYDKQSFKQYAHNSGIKWDKASTRDEFFKKTMSFMVVLIDPIYDVSEYYWSGIDAVGQYSSKQLKAAKNKSSYDLKDIMTAFTQGTSPKF